MAGRFILLDRFIMSYIGHFWIPAIFWFLGSQWLDMRDPFPHSGESWDVVGHGSVNSWLPWRTLPGLCLQLL